MKSEDNIYFSTRNKYINPIKNFFFFLRIWSWQITFPFVAPFSLILNDSSSSKPAFYYNKNRNHQIYRTWLCYCKAASDTQKLLIRHTKITHYTSKLSSVINRLTILNLSLWSVHGENNLRIKLIIIIYWSSSFNDQEDI